MTNDCGHFQQNINVSECIQLLFITIGLNKEMYEVAKIKYRCIR